MVLINCSSNRAEKLGGFSRYVPISVPIGIGYLAAALRDKGKKVEIIDDEVMSVTGELLEEKVKSLKRPYIFGLSCLTAGIARGHELAVMIKKKYPDSKVLFGNVHPTVMPDAVLSDRNADIVVRGEAEDIILQLYDKLKKNEDFSGVRGISFRGEERFVHNERAPLPDLSSLPRFPYGIFKDHSRRYELGFVASSRGCPYNCIFCSQRSISGRSYRFFPSEIVIQDLEDLVNKYGCSYITFVDDSFLVNKNRVALLCGMIRERGLHKKAIFDCQARGDTIDDQILKELKDSGFRTIHFGIETASERLMEILNKKETVQQVIDGIKLAKKHGFQVSGTFILGLPTETGKERRAAYELAKELDLNYVRFNNATPYPGTKLYDIAVAEKRLNAGKDWVNLNACGTLVESPFKRCALAYVPSTVFEGDLRHDILKFNLFYSFRPISIYKVLRERVGPAGWLALPEKWYFKPGEWIYLTKFGLKIACLFAKILTYPVARIFVSRQGNE